MNIGYVVASFDLKNLSARVPGHDQSITLAIDNILIPDTKMPVCIKPVANAPECIDGKAVLLKVEYDNIDVYPGTPGADIEHISLASIEHASFMDEDDNLKFGHLFDPKDAQVRRQTFRRESLLAGEFARKYVVLRAMSQDASHLFPVDWVYISSGSILKAMTKRVIEAYTSGDRSKLFSSTEKSLMLALDHAATMAMSYSKPQHVTSAVVDNKHLYMTTNAGEFLYDGATPAKVESLIDVCAQGIPTLAVSGPPRQRLLASKL